VGNVRFVQVHPIVGTRDIRKAIDFYVRCLGFALAFQDGGDPPNYVGFRRGDVVLHMQFQYPYEMGTIRLRLLVDDPDGLYAEYQGTGAANPGKAPADTAWGTREFALYDPDGNALTFYRQR
jgi:catechol 2,3-dioxygenase-like lactoylglutathione lyase family enzyme